MGAIAVTRSMTEQKTRQEARLARIEHDARADGGERLVRLVGGDVLIARRLAGISMLIGVPVRAYRGVALSVRPAESGGASYRLSLSHRDPDLEVVLAETGDCAAVPAEWRYWAFRLGLPRLTDNGEAAAQASAAPARRRGAKALASRRPRFLVRRKPGDPSRGGEVFAGEREIVCYE